MQRAYAKAHQNAHPSSSNNNNITQNSIYAATTFLLIAALSTGSSGRTKSNILLGAAFLGSVLGFAAGGVYASRRNVDSKNK